MVNFNILYFAQNKYTTDLSSRTAKIFVSRDDLVFL
jgi:hypothetical protein